MDKVRESSPGTANKKIDEQTEKNIREYSHKGKAKISERLEQLDKEWDIERILELNASALALTGVGLALKVHRNWIWLSVITMTFLAHHAIQGWCPPVPLLRKMGYRTRDEINKEKTALKALKGDYKKATSAEDLLDVV